MIIVYMTAKDKVEALKIAHTLLSKKLIACANIIDGATSVYEWEGKVCEESECVIIAKSSDDSFDAIQKEVLSLHSYENPAIICLKADDASSAFGKWVEEQVGATPPSPQFF